MIIFHEAFTEYYLKPLAQKLSSFVKETTRLLQNTEDLNKDGPFLKGALLVSWDVLSLSLSLSLFLPLFLSLSFFGWVAGWGDSKAFLIMLRILLVEGSVENKNNLIYLI